MSIKALAVAQSACPADENVLISCTIGAKTMALCKSGADDIHYRFGKPGRAPDLLYPRDSRRTQNAFFWNSWSGAKGGGQFVTFKNGDSVYTVYDVQKAFSAEEGDTGAGVFVMKDGLLIANLRCREHSPPQKLSETFPNLGLAPSPFGNPPFPQDEPLSKPLFAGEWEAELCPEAKGFADAPQCSQFFVSLFERQGRLCGVHNFVTADAGRVDEGFPPSIEGPITANKADVVVTSGRADIKRQVSIERYRDGRIDYLRWRMPTPATGSDALLPVNANLTRATEPLFSEQGTKEAREACEAAAAH